MLNFIIIVLISSESFTSLGCDPPEGYKVEFAIFPFDSVVSRKRGKLDARKG